MGLTKTELFTQEQNQLAQIAKTIAHPARIAILQYLIKAQSCINTNLVQEIGLAQPTISQHLRELKDAGIIKGTVEGSSMSYCIDPDRWMEIQSLFEQFFQNIPRNNQNNCC